MATIYLRRGREKGGRRSVQGNETNRDLGLKFRRSECR